MQCKYNITENDNLKKKNLKDIIIIQVWMLIQPMFENSSFSGKTERINRDAQQRHKYTGPPDI